jgi:methionine-rich copper-binding protein CopC
MGRVLEYFGLVTPVESGPEAENPVPRVFTLHQNYPNPFNPTTTITFALPGEDLRQTTLRIYNLLGQQVRTLLETPLAPGFHRVTWNGLDDGNHPVSSGIYFYVLRAGPFVGTRKMVLIK